MSDVLKPYPAYKDSGVPWLGDVPAHWEVLPHRALFQEVNDRNHPDESLLSVTIARGVIPQKALLTDSSKKDSSNLDKSNYKLVQPGDIAYNKMRAWQGAIGVSQYRGIVSPAYVIIRPRQQQAPEYYHYLLRTPGFIKEAERWSYGITSDMWSLRAEDFKRIYGVLPPLNEQRAIAAFLAHHDRLTRRYIRAQQRLIKLLTEQKQALIQQAVTRGLDHDVPLKDSGIEWLGKIPAHWEIIPLKNLSIIQSGLTLGKNYIGRELVEYPYLRVANVQDGRLDLSQIKTVLITEEEVARCTLQDGDVLMTEGGDPDKLGRGCVWKDQIKPCLHQNHIFAVRPNSNRLLPYFLAALLTSQYAKTYFLRTAKQTTNLASTNKTTIGQFSVLLPSLEEQREILGALESKTAQVQQAITHTQSQIALVREYRTRLIADVVTGKLDVRDVVLPDLEDDEATDYLAGAEDEESDQEEMEAQESGD